MAASVASNDSAALETNSADHGKQDSSMNKEEAEVSSEKPGQCLECGDLSRELCGRMEDPDNNSPAASGDQFINKNCEVVIQAEGIGGEGKQPEVISRGVIQTEVIGGEVIQAEVMGGAVIQAEIMSGGVRQTEVIGGAASEPEVISGAVNQARVSCNSVSQASAKDSSVNLDKVIGNTDDVALVKVSSVNNTSVVDCSLSQAPFVDIVNSQAMVMDGTGGQAASQDSGSSNHATDNTESQNEAIETAFSPSPVQDIAVSQQQVKENAAAQATSKGSTISQASVKDNNSNDHKIPSKDCAIGQEDSVKDNVSNQIPVKSNTVSQASIKDANGQPVANTVNLQQVAEVAYTQSKFLDGISSKLRDNEDNSNSQISIRDDNISQPLCHVKEDNLKLDVVTSQQGVACITNVSPITADEAVIVKETQCLPLDKSKVTELDENNIAASENSAILKAPIENPVISQEKPVISQEKPAISQAPGENPSEASVEPNDGDGLLQCGDKTELASVNALSENKADNNSKIQENNAPKAESSYERSELTPQVSYDDDVFEDRCKDQDSKTLDSSPPREKLYHASSLPGSGKPFYRSMSEQTDRGASEERPVREMLVRRIRSASTETSSDRPVLDTLSFSSTKLNEAIKESKAESEADECVCLLCDRSYPADNKDVLAHLVLMHKFVIADVNFIASLPAYLRYWKERFQEKQVSEFCSKIVTNTGAKDHAPKEEFYLLCDALPEDKSIREHLQRKKLECVLAQQQREREETKFCRQCLFCKQTFCGNRAVLFDHLLRDHTFHMGQPDNLVYTDELFDLIQSKLDSQLCLFCEKSFKDKASLREHMRKKQHRKINPKNKEYDRFYIVNYMEMGKNWESLQSEDNRLIRTSERDSDEEEEWSGWNEESESKVVCLFCDLSFIVQTDLQQHMKDMHSFDLQEVNNKLQLNFYQKVKLINYIRRLVYHKTCYGCQQVFEDKEQLLSHFDEFSDHLKKIPESEVWDQPQYFFPTYEDDCLLCHLDDDDEGAAGDALGVTVIAEAIPVADTILKDHKLCRDLKS